MVDELISRKALMDAFRAYMVEHFDKDKCAKVENCEVCEKRCLWHEVVASVPAADAVEVVRCASYKNREWFIVAPERREENHLTFSKLEDVVNESD